MYLSGGGIPDVVRYSIIQDSRGRGLDVGTGPFKANNNFVGLRERKDTTLPANMPADYVCDSFADMCDFADNAFDVVMVHGKHAHPAYNDAALDAEILRVMNEGARLIKAPGNETSHHDISFWKKTGGKLVPYFPYAGESERGPKTVCIVRHGAIGDTMQATSILRALKNEGYHITWMCEPSGHELLVTEPLIDAFLIQDKDQVPNQLLHPYWGIMRKRFTRWINLSESIEGTLVKIQGRSDYHFPKAVRHELCDKNYLEFTAKIAETEFHPEHYFYPTPDEEKEAIDFLDGMTVPQEKSVDGLPLIGMAKQKVFTIMWVLSGSSPDKFYPHMDAVIARIMLEIPHAHVIFAGDAWCALLESGWENEPRVHSTSGQQSIRQTLTLAQKCDLVIGPDTGVLNAVAFESNAKIVLISHATPENVTKHWVNTETITNEITPCWPCHRLHSDHTYCPEEPTTGAAMCQFNNPPAVVWDAVQRAFLGRETVKRILTA